MQVRCGWSWRFVTKRLLFSVGVDSTGTFSVNLVDIVLGASENISRENSIVYIYTNWSSCGMLTIFEV